MGSTRDSLPLAANYFQYSGNAEGYSTIAVRFQDSSFAVGVIQTLKRASHRPATVSLYNFADKAFEYAKSAKDFQDPVAISSIKLGLPAASVLVDSSGAKNMHPKMRPFEDAFNCAMKVAKKLVEPPLCDQYVFDGVQVFRNSKYSSSAGSPRSRSSKRPRSSESTDGSPSLPTRDANASNSNSLHGLAQAIEKKLMWYIAGNGPMEDLQERLQHETVQHQACRASLVDLQGKLAAVEAELSAIQEVLPV